jgi:DNA polymerase
LLEATVQHLERLKARGVRFVSVSPQILKDLASRRGKPGRGNVPGPKARENPQLQAKAANMPTPDSGPVGTITQVAPPLEPVCVDQPQSKAPVLVLSPEAKAAAFDELRQRALGCGRCGHLASSRKNVVFGVGDINAQLMFIGEAPGADEDELGEPFVGKAGQLLTKIIQTMGLSRGSVYIANILKCRPDTPGQASGNRKPTPEEMQTCIPYLHEQIDLIQPRVIVALGATAVEGLLGKTIGITRLRGNWRTYRGIPLMPTYHPAYLLRNQALSEKRRVWEDMLQVMGRLDLPISEKQRNYFLQ